MLARSKFNRGIVSISGLSTIGFSSLEVTVGAATCYYTGAGIPLPAGAAWAGGGFELGASSLSLVGLITGGIRSSFTSPLNVTTERKAASAERLASDGNSR